MPGNGSTADHGGARALAVYGSELRLAVAPRRRTTVRVGCSEGLPADWLFAALAKFRDQRPEVEVEVTGGIGTALADLVRQGALDILVSAQCGTSGGANYSSRPIA